MAFEEGIYVVEFGSVAGAYRNGGIVVLDSQKVYGGDSGYYYLGSYVVKDGGIRGDVEIVKHRPGGWNAFGDDANQYNVVVNGVVSDNGDMQGQMYRVDKPGFVLPVRFLLKKKF